MNGFLVIGRTSNDDLPLHLCTERAEAEQFASDVTEDIDRWSRACMYADAGSYICVGIMEFVGGTPQPLRIVKSFDR